MIKDYLTDNGNRKSEKLPVSYNDNLPSTEIQKPFYAWQEKEEISLHDYLDVIIRRKWLIVTFLMLVFLSTLTFTLASTKIYKAVAIIEVNQNMPSSFPFTNGYRIEYKNAVLVYNFTAPERGESFGTDFMGNLKIYKNRAKKGKLIALKKEDGYTREINYFIDRIINDKPIEIATLNDAIKGMKIYEKIKSSLEKNNL